VQLKGVNVRGMNASLEFGQRLSAGYRTVAETVREHFLDAAIPYGFDTKVAALSRR